MSTDPTLYGPVCAGKVGVGLIRLSQVMLTVAKGLACFAGRRKGKARWKVRKARENDSVIVAGINCGFLKEMVFGDTKTYSAKNGGKESSDHETTTEAQIGKIKDMAVTQMPVVIVR